MSQITPEKLELLHMREMTPETLTVHQRGAIKMGRYAQSSVRATWGGHTS